MSSFVRNLVLRAAGLAPVAAPVAKPVLEGPALLEEPVLDVVEEEAAAPAVSRPKVESAKAVEPVKSREAQKAAPVAKERAVDPAPLPVREAVVPEAPREKAAEPVRRVEVVPEVRAETREVVAQVEPVRSAEPIPQVAPVVEVERERVSESVPVMEATPVKELVFVDAPPLPAQILRQLEQSVMEQVPAEAGRVEVHIGRVEVVQPAAPPPPPSRARREPRGFADHRLERNYLNRRWY